jgi:citrate lyase subunit beta/citryl-CoA lyase
MIHGWRSLLFVSADDGARLAKVHGYGADCVILDLEDAVPAERKQPARAGLAAHVARLRVLGCEVCVRVNPGAELAQDLAAAIAAGAGAIMLPKAEDPVALAETVALIARIVGDGACPGIVALVESAVGVLAAGDLAAVPGVTALAFGTEDFALSMGVPPVAALLDLPSRQIALAARARGVDALAMSLSIAAFRDGEAFAAAARAAMACGSTGALCIHPRQVEAANRAFGPDAEDIARARGIVDAWEAAQGAGVIEHEGRMIDRPVVELAMMTLARSRG